ncbi:MAG: TIM barrel protein [Candidatus Bathyarchaeia archaeon]
MLDLRKQKRYRVGEEMLRHLERFPLALKFSAGVWYFFPSGGRFHERYVPQGSMEEVLDKVRSLYDRGAVDRNFRLEAHYPNEVNRENLDLFRELEKETGIKLLTVIPNLFYDRIWEFGSLSNPKDEIRQLAIDRTVEALTLNRELATDFAIVWPGIDGYENPLGTDFYHMWNRFESGLAEAMDAVPGIRVAIEPKPYEPRGNNIYRNTANGILMARNVEALLKAEENRRLLKEGHALVALNPEVGHVLMGHEELAYAFASILREGRLAHTHWNSQPLGNYDQDLNVGVLGIDQTYAALLVLKMYGYEGYFGIDINPERMPVEKALILNMNALTAACTRLNEMDYKRIVEAMYNPQENRGVVEDIVTRALAPKSAKLINFS